MVYAKKTKPRNNKQVILMIKHPESMDECVYFTRRALDDGHIMAWVFRVDCSECDEGKMVKPLTKTGKPDKKSPIYVCNKCDYEQKNEDVEELFQVNVEYTCPHCKYKGLTSTDYKRRTFKGVKAFVFNCQECAEKIPITKKLKSLK